MSKNLAPHLKPMRYALMLAMFAFVFGFGLGIGFGAGEAQIKQALNARAVAALDEVYRGDRKRADAVQDKSWSYFKRAHLHAGAMGAAALSMMLLLVQLPGAQALKNAAANMLGAGAVGYPLFWLLAGWRAPAVGDTHIAKESLGWLAIPTAGMFLLGTLIVFGLLAAAAARKP